MPWSCTRDLLVIDAVLFDLVSIVVSCLPRVQGGAYSASMKSLVRETWVCEMCQVRADTRVFRERSVEVMGCV